MTDLIPHRAASVFPMLSDSDLRALADDIKANGQAIPIAVLNGTFILDGRNRYAACKLAGVEPITKEMQSEFSDDAEVIRFIVSTNLHRRHLTESQRAMIANELAKLGEGRPGKETASIEAVMSQGQAAEAMQVSRASVQRAREVQEKAPDLAEKVKAGELKVSKAVSIARERAKPKPQTDHDRAADDDSNDDSDGVPESVSPSENTVELQDALLDFDSAYRRLINAQSAISDKRTHHLIREMLRSVSVDRFLGIHRVRTRLLKITPVVSTP